MKSIYAASFLFLLALLINSTSFAQEALKPRPSPMYVATVKYQMDESDKITYVKVTYCRPAKKGRTIFGNGDDVLVPYGQVWRTGANEATEITFTRDVKVGGKKMKAGTYTIFSIPEKDKWTIIFNNELGQWGAYSYNPTNDVLKIDAMVEQMEEVYEPFTIEFELQDNIANMVFIWDTTKAYFPIEF